jgi:chemotaxis protein methyltransferase CheR
MREPGDVDVLQAAIARARAGTSAPRLDAQTFLGLRDLIADASGIAFDERSRFIVERRLQSRLRALRLDDFEAYHRYLLFGPDAAAETARMLEAVTIRETYFFREWQQLEAFRDEILPSIAEENAGTKTLRVWSAGCATGEEPYSVAVLVLESGLFDGWDVRIVGTDLVRSALGAARRGLFRDASMRATPDDVRDRYFAREGTNAWRLDERVRRAVEFEPANLIDPAACAALPAFDAVFCRNVLIYFGELARRRAASIFHDRLRTGGRLLLGHAESLLSLHTPFALVHLKRDIVYVK